MKVAHWLFSVSQGDPGEDGKAVSTFVLLNILRFSWYSHITSVILLLFCSRWQGPSGPRGFPGSPGTAGAKGEKVVITELNKMERSCFLLIYEVTAIYLAWWGLIFPGWAWRESARTQRPPRSTRTSWTRHRWPSSTSTLQTLFSFSSFYLCHDMFVTEFLQSMFW